MESMKILIVDDNKLMRTTIRLLLHSPANEFEECEDGGTAVAAYDAFHPDLVLMDITMKGMDGITATKNICSRFPEANVVIVTDYDDDAIRKAATDAGASGYVMKEHLYEIRNIVNH